MFSSLSSSSLWKKKKRNVVVTATGSTTKMLADKAGASKIRKKHHVIWFVIIIYIDKRIERMLDINYPQSIYKLPEPMEKMIPRDEDSETSKYLNYFGDNITQELAKTVSEQNDLGLAQTLYEQMKRNYGISEIPTVTVETKQTTEGDDTDI